MFGHAQDVYKTTLQEIAGAGLFESPLNHRVACPDELQQAAGINLRTHPVAQRGLMCKARQQVDLRNSSRRFTHSPCRIQHHDELLTELLSAGYERRDGWRNTGINIRIPFVNGGEQLYYAGGCFDLFN